MTSQNCRTIKCTVCQQDRPLSCKGMCVRCYNQYVRQRRGSCSDCGATRTLDDNGRCRPCQLKSNQRVCDTCGRVGVKMHTQRRCEMCYNRDWRNRREPTPCGNCGELTHNGSKCSRCRMYFRDNGHERPVDPEIRTELRRIRSSISRKKVVAARGFVSCRHCRDNRAVANGLCNTCYNYKLRNGKARPKHLIYQRCNNCKCPIGSSSRSGLCRRCYLYNNVFNKPRPERVWKTVDPWLGWCECSTRTKPVPAIHTIKFEVGSSGSQNRRYESLHLCERCHVEYVRIEKQGIHFEMTPTSSIRRAK